MDGDQVDRNRRAENAAGAMLLLLGLAMIANAFVVVRFTVDDGSGMAKGFALIGCLVFMLPTFFLCVSAGVVILVQDSPAQLGRITGLVGTAGVFTVVGFELWIRLTGGDWSLTSLVGALALIALIGLAVFTVVLLYRFDAPLAVDVQESENSNS
jgi:hypothetical protein